MRIHFTNLDLARTHLADGPDPLWELVGSVQALQGRHGQRVLGAWRRHAAVVLRRSGLAGPVRHRLFAVAPHAQYFPDLLTPPEGRLGFGPGLDAVLATPRRRLRGEIGRLGGRGGAGTWLADLCAGRSGALYELGHTMREYHRQVITPGWASLSTIVGGDLAVRRGALHTGGVEAMLHSFGPLMRWRYPVLELPGHPSTREVHLRGRGLLLVPSWFCRQNPVTIFDPELPQVIVYPVGHPPAAGRAGGQALARLLGETRAAVLLATGAGGTTGELAQLLGVSAATISHHTAVLRDAGLINSARSATTVRHSLSRLGEAMVSRHPAS